MAIVALIVATCLYISYKKRKSLAVEAERLSVAVRKASTSFKKSVRSSFGQQIENDRKNGV